MDLVNFTAVHTLRHDHTVYALPPEDMPADECVAGLYHLPLPSTARP